MAQLRAVLAAEVPDGALVAANPRSRMLEPLNLEVVRLGERGYDPAQRAIIWCYSATTGEQCGFVLEGEQVVMLVD